ncbi:MAG: 23S rRNA (uracil(1939)-C(5))-methyltransferase RlmD [Eubacteriales bacterium]|nr:23S rRNA (uracil(1939)-C(5))-methyltransferase RlmD [Eubacteriales bacterium]
MFVKNDLLRLHITDMGIGKEGIGKVDSFPIFVKDALPGDYIEAKITKVKKQYAYGRLERIIEASPERIEPRCPVHRPCGGCQIAALDYKAALRFKQDRVKQQLIRLGGQDEATLERIMEPIIGMEDPYHYRNKAQFPVGRDVSGKVISGFYAAHSHRIIPHDDNPSGCSIGQPLADRIRRRITAFLQQKNIPIYDEISGRGQVRHIFIRIGHSSGQVMVCLIVNAAANRCLPWEADLIRELTEREEIPGLTGICLNYQQEPNNVILGPQTRCIWGRSYIEDSIQGLTFHISVNSFYQVNSIQMEKLYATALDFADLSPADTVWDIYCGIGTISLCAAKQAGHVYGVEYVERAILDARANAVRNGLTNTDFYVGAAEEVLPRLYREENIKASVIIVDPPRKGCDPAVLETIARMEPQRLVYVSCDVATLARDVKRMEELGYRLERVRAVDMFPWTVHVEGVVLMSRKEK